MAEVRGLLIDIDGVLVVSWKAIDGAPQALAAVRSAGVPVRFLTNTTSKTKADITRSLRTAGFDVDEDEVVTAGSAIASHLARHHPGARCLLLNSGDVRADLPGVDLVTPADLAAGGDGGAAAGGDGGPKIEVVVIGGAGPEFTYEAMNLAFAALLGGAALVAAHHNVTWKTDAGLVLDAGAYVAALERASGVRAVVVGKPNVAMFEAGSAAMGLARSAVAMIGDDLDTDVRGAQAAGLTGVQVRTGKFRPEQLANIGSQPDVVLDSFADVPSWLDGLTADQVAAR